MPILAVPPGDQPLLLREASEAVRFHQSFLWTHALRGGLNFDQTGSDEVLDELLSVLGHYERPQAADRAPQAAEPWLLTALDDAINGGVHVSPTVLLRLYEASNITVLDRLFQRAPTGISETARALLVCQAALVREPMPEGYAPDVEGSARDLFHVESARRTHFLEGIARWGLPTEVTLTPDDRSRYSVMFDTDRISLPSLDGSGAFLTAMHTNNQMGVNDTVYLADHWLGPRNVFESHDEETVQEHRRTFARMLEEVALNSVFPTATSTVEKERPRPRL